MNNQMPALMISFEGIDGCGKSTQVAMFVDRLTALGVDMRLVREPGGTSTSERIRELLLDARADITPRAELLLFAAARAQLVDEVIRPSLEAGNVVVCDRFFDSTTAYQGGGRGLADLEWLDSFHRFTTGGLAPTRTYIIDVPLETASLRRGAVADRMEAAGEPFFDRVREAYLALGRLDAGRVRVIDGVAAPETVHAQIWEDFEQLLSGMAYSQIS